jgi:hypothetical protein
MRTITKANVLEKIKWKLDNCKEINDKFAARFATDPVDAFKWSHDTFKNAAIEHVYKLLQHLVNEDRTMSQIRKHFVENYTRGAKWPECSTSPASNLMSQCLTAAYVEICEEIEDWEIE